MGVADDLYNDVNGLMRDMGQQPMTVTRQIPGTYDPSSGAVGPPTTASLYGLGRLGAYSDMAVDGTLIQQFDRRVTFAASPRQLQTLVPRIGDRLLVGQDVYAVINVKPREIGGQWICFTIQARR